MPRQRKTTTAARRGKKDETFIATDSGVAEIGEGEDRQILTFVKGKTRIRSGHPLLTSVPHCFEPASESLHYEETR